jgi:HlyD family secretion protein
MKRPRFLVVGAVAVVVIGAAFAVLLWPRAVVVDTVVVDRGEIVEELVEDGRVRWRDRALIAAPVAGVLAAPWLRVGDPVTAGDVVARLLPLPTPLVGGAERAGLVAAEDAAAAALAQATATLERARATAAAMALEEQRVTALVAVGGAPRAQADDARARTHAAGHEVEAAVFAVQVARAQWAVARAARERVEQRPDRRAGSQAGDGPALLLRAPLTGTVLAVPTADAGPVAVGAPLVELACPRAVELVVPLLSEDATRLTTAVTARVSAWGGPDLVGHVQRVEPRATTRLSALGIEEQRANVIVDVDELPSVPPGDGYRVRVAFALWRGVPVRVRSAALVRGSQGWGAWRIVDGRAAWAAVTPGHRGAGHVEVISGLSVGDVVIEHPGEHVVQGLRVRERYSGDHVR